MGRKIGEHPAHRASTQPAPPPTAVAGQRLKRQSAFAARAPDAPAPLNLAFFPLAGALAAILPLPFIPGLNGIVPLSAWWHAREGVFGIGTALLCGFLLTAFPHWLGKPATPRIAVLLLLSGWVAGRIATAHAALTGALAPILIDAATLLGLAFYTLAMSLAADRRRPRKIAWQVLAFAAAVLVHDAALILGTDTGPGLRLGQGVLVMLLMVILGRMLPVLTEQELGRNATPAAVKRFDRLDLMALAATGAALVSWALFPFPALSGILAILAASLNAARVLRWRGWRTRWAPLLSPLHIAYGFITLGFALMAARIFVPSSVGAQAATHAFLAGGMATAAVIVMTRMAGGHCGTKPRFRLLNLSLVMIWMAALLRIGAGLNAPYQMPLLEAAAILWPLAYTLFVMGVLIPLLRTQRDG